MSDTDHELHFLDTISSNIEEAKRCLVVLELLFLPPDTDSNVMHIYQEGLFKLFEQALTVQALVALRRCLDKSRQSFGMRNHHKSNGNLGLSVSPELQNKFDSLLDKIIVHSDPSWHAQDYWKKIAMTRRELWECVDKTIEAVNNVRESANLQPLTFDHSKLSNQFDRLLDDIHLAAQMKQLRDRAEEGLAPTLDDVMSFDRPNRDKPASSDQW